MIVQLEEAKQQLAILKNDAAELKDALNIEELSAKVKELEEATCAEDFWGRDDTQSVMSELNNARNTVNNYNDLSDGIDSLFEMIEMAIEMDDESFQDLIRAMTNRESWHCFRVSLIRITPFLPFIRVPAEPRRRTGRLCSTVCIAAGQKRGALR